MFRRTALSGLRESCIAVSSAAVSQPALTHRPSSCRVMLGEHTSIAACHRRQQEQRVLHERGTSATSFAIVRLHVTSGYPYASVVCMGPGYGPLSVYGRCVVLILLDRGSRSPLVVEEVRDLYSSTLRGAHAPVATTGDGGGTNKERET